MYIDRLHIIFENGASVTIKSDFTKKEVKEFQKSYLKKTVILNNLLAVDTSKIIYYEFYESGD